MKREKSIVSLGGALLLLAILATYANHFHNSFHFDDWHTIVNNTSIRELRNVPLFFRDATTFSAVPGNQSYRPLVSTLLAIDYRLGHGLEPFWFHLSISVLFIALTLLLAFVIHHLLDSGAAPLPGWIALITVAWYALHPANADTINYIISSSDVISALGVVASFAVYFAFPQVRRYYFYVLPAAIAILAKPTSAIFAVLFAVFCLLFPDPAVGERRLHPRERFVEVVQPFVICGAVLLFVGHMTPRSWTPGAVNAHNYLITQPYVALLYFKTFFWPTGLSAVYDLKPFVTTGDTRFWIGLAFAVFISAAAIATAIWKKTRMIGFGLLWFLIALLPTSLFPLAEVMNDHRTFLPYIGLVIAIAGAAPKAFGVARLDRQQRWAKIAATCAVALFLCANAYATFQRNKVWKTEETLWHDVVLKSPRNGIGLMSYGIQLMAKGDFAGALDYFHRAQHITPRYPALLINLAIAENATRQSAEAEQHFNEALRLAPSSPGSYTYYARYLLSHSRADEARALLQRALELSPNDLYARELLKEAQTRASELAPLAGVEINQPVNKPALQTPQFYLALSLQFYREERYIEAIFACRRALDLRPDYAEAWDTMGAVYNKLGRYEEAAAACERALLYKPGYENARINLQYARAKLKTLGK
ncbi:MAG: tetratricopeptide repeat protein [Verrucomicrobia bacterium]|nr:MAG: tetratricopeptide repeat protein [Verrucomicrobiota bacterium]